MESDDVDTTPTSEADADLVLRARSGDRGAYAELWRRHYRSGITVARSITSSLDADDPAALRQPIVALSGCGKAFCKLANENIMRGA